MIEQVLYDCDNTMGLPMKEIDDGLTLLYLLGRPDVEILGVTTTFGNGTIDEVHPQTQQLLRDVGRADIPVHKGCALSSKGRALSLSKGAEARGQPPMHEDLTDVFHPRAARFLAETVAAHPGQITLLATGPLGNLRAAAELDPAFFGNLKQIVCMGGYLHPLRIGWRDLPELNLSADPAATLAVLSAPCPVTLMNAHVCLQASFGWRDLKHVAHWGRDTRRIVRNWLLTFGLYCGVRVFYLWDLLPAVYVSYPDLFDANPVWVRSTVADLETGSLVIGNESKGVHINMPTRILDLERFRTILFDAWRRTSLD